MKPVYEFDTWKKVKLSKKTEADTKKMYWKSVGNCKGGHIVICYDIVKQPHCPVCEPGIDMEKHWVSIWNDPCPACGKK